MTSSAPAKVIPPHLVSINEHHQFIAPYKTNLESLYRDIADVTFDYIYRLTFAGGSVWVEDMWNKGLDIGGYSLAELNVPGGWAELLHPDDYAHVGDIFAQVINNGQATKLEFRVITKQGEVRWLLCYVKPDRQPHRHAHPRLIGAFQEITTSKMAEQALRESEQRYRALFEHTSDAVIHYGLDLMPIAVNRNMAAMLGYTVEEIMQVPITTYTAPEEATAATQRRQERLAGQDQSGTYERTLIAKDGSRVHVELNNALIRDAGGQPLYFQSIGRDISARKQAEQALRESEERYRIISELTSDCIYSLSVGADARGKLNWIAGSFTQLMGYSEAELLAIDGLELIHPDDRVAVAKRIQAVLAQQAHSTIEYRLITKLGAIKWVESSIRAVVDAEQPGLVHVIGALKDITERKEYEQQLFYLSNHDLLTGLPNRRQLEDRLGQAIARAQAVGETVLLLIDLDKFKVVNDTLGHAAGDEALCYIAQLLAAQLPPTAMLARLGGDEFALLLEYTPIVAAATVAEQLREAVTARPFFMADKQFSLSLSIGLVSIDGSENLRTVLFQADTAMYIAKREGGNRLLIYHQL